MAQGALRVDPRLLDAPEGQMQKQSLPQEPPENPENAQDKAREAKAHGAKQASRDAENASWVANEKEGHLAPEETLPLAPLEIPLPVVPPNAPHAASSASKVKQPKADTKKETLPSSTTQHVQNDASRIAKPARSKVGNLAPLPSAAQTFEPSLPEAQGALLKSPAPERSGQPHIPSYRPPENPQVALKVDPALLGMPEARAPLAKAEPTMVSQTTLPLSAQAQAIPVTTPAIEKARGSEPSLSEARSLRPSEAPSSTDDENAPLAKTDSVFLSAERMAGTIDKEFIATGQAHLLKEEMTLTAERLTYWPVEDEVEAEGDAHLLRGGDTLEGPKMRLRIDNHTGFVQEPIYTIAKDRKTNEEVEAARFFESLSLEDKLVSWLNSGFETQQAANFVPGQASFDPDENHLKPKSGQGRGDYLELLGENQYRFTNATFSTCRLGREDWYLKAGTLHLDYDEEEASGRDATLYFKDVPIFYSPWLSFALSDERKSGFLTPHIGSNSETGFEIDLPYYWNIAPNLDASFAPKILGSRGLFLQNEVRYTNRAFGGIYNSQLTYDLLPNDAKAEGKNRWQTIFQHVQTLPYGFSVLANYNRVSDDSYFTDLGGSVTKTSTTQLLQQAQLTYGGGGWWTANLNVQQYQTLQPDPNAFVLAPYKMLPQLTLNARRPDFLGADASFFGQSTHFSRKDEQSDGVNRHGPTGTRHVLYPQIAYPFANAYAYLTPKIGLNMRRYSLSGQAHEVPQQLNVTLPVMSIDSGLTFERDSIWFGKHYTQTLEPRLYYVRIPYQDQSQLPIFDTGLADFNFAQIFSENQFSGWDRINNANQITAALSSRLLDPQSGSEIMRFMLGQRFHFEQNRVETQAREKWERSDILGTLSGQVLPKVYIDTALQYGVTENHIQRYSAGMSIRPEAGKSLSASYRYNRDAQTPINQVDITGQWPIFGRWYGVGRVNYSLKDKGDGFSTRQNQPGRVVEAIAGLEYDGDCWVLRVVVHRLALTQETTSNAFFVLLELNDFAKIGSNPLDLLKRNIQGYRQINRLPDHLRPE